MLNLDFINEVIKVGILFNGFLISFIIGLLLACTQRWHGYMSEDVPYGIQKSHILPTSRIGGVSILISLFILTFQTTSDIFKLLMPMLIAGTPAFIFGFAEDLTKKISVRHRLIATIASGLLACLITDYSLTRIEIWGLNTLLQFSIISIIFTGFAVGGVANSINIIDGFNGLVLFTSAIAFTGFAIIAYQVGDLNLFGLSLIYISCIFGLFCINWPFGRIFLGDGGAYFIGFSLAWIAVLLIERNISISPFSALLICIVPITEVLLTIFRRSARNKNISAPDNLHFHSILHQRYIRRWMRNFSALTKNSFAGILVGGISLISTSISINIYTSTLLCIISVVLFIMMYVTIYVRMVKFCWHFPISFLIINNKKF
jgi:UDP-N-acetylmuramyl pentapeptide phosphotransferase/UDP-N-acetylglucosamine-1-phosphate transferase